MRKYITEKLWEEVDILIQDCKKNLYLRLVRVIRLAPFEFPQGRNAARVKSCSGAI